MTVTATNRKNNFTTNGVTVDFTFTFAITNIQQVNAITIINGVETPYTNFTVAPSPSTEGGTLTTLDVLDGVELLIYRDTSLTQQVDYQDGGRFPADSHEQALDKLTLQNQDQQDDLNRSLKTKIGDDSDYEVGNLESGKLVQVVGKELTTDGSQDTTGYTDIQAIARSLNVPFSAVIYSTDTTRNLDGVQYIYDNSNETTWSKPSGAQAGDVIVSVVDDQLTVTSGTYTMVKVETNNFKFDTILQAKTVSLPVGARVEWDSYYDGVAGGGNKGVVKTGAHVDDGGSIFSIDANKYIEADHSSRVIDVRQFGARYGKSQGFQNQFIINALKYLNDSATDEINPIIKTGRVLYNGLLHIGSQQIQIPPYCSFELDGHIPDSISFGPGGFGSAPDDMPILWFDVSYTEKVIPFCISGYWQAGGTNPGQLVNLATENVTSGDNDAGKIQTNRGAKFKAICFTDQFCVAPVQIAAGHESEIEISASEFLHPYVAATCWDIKAKVGGFNHHSGGAFYNINSFRISGYSNKSSGGGAPALDASTFIPQWGPENGTQNPPALREMTVGTSGWFGSGIDTSGLLQQSWQRARFCQNVNGWFEGGAYYEQISDILWHSVTSFFTSITPRITMSGGGVFRCGGDTSGEISNPTYSATTNIPSWDGGIVTAFPSARMRVTLRDQESHVWDDHPQIDFNFLSPDKLSIKVDPVNGDDTKSGLSNNAKVKKIDRAVEMSDKYNAIDVIIDHGTTAVVTSLVNYPSSIRFLSSDITQTNPVIQPEVNGGVLDGGIAVSDQIIFDHVDVNCQATTGAGSARGLIRATGGNIRVTCSNMTLTTEPNSGLIAAGENASSQTLMFVFDQSTKAGTGNIGVNAFGSNGECRVVLASTTNINALWESNYNLVT